MASSSMNDNVDNDTGKAGHKSKYNEFCKVCNDFKTWMRQSKATDRNSGKSSSGVGVTGQRDVDIEQTRRADCPLDKDELGRSTWAFLHTIGATFPEEPTPLESNNMEKFLHLLSRVYPCGPCAEELQAKMKTLPPKTKSRRQLANWFCEIHNDVNRRLGKKEFDCRLVDERWRDGWKDGSCEN